MRRFPKVLTILSVMALGACSHYSDDLAALDGKIPQMTQQNYAAMDVAPHEIAPAAGGPAAMGATMNSFLASEYYELARYENDKAYDYKAAKQFTKKAMSAKKGEFTAPSKISAFDVPKERVPELTEARAGLVEALKTQNMPENAAVLAKAQASFDCWLERAEEADEASHYAACKSQFEQSMASLVTPAAGDASAPTYQIGFLHTSAVPDELSQKLIGDIANYMNAPENASFGIALSAPSDETGQARMNAVQSAFVASGVSPDRLSVSAQMPVQQTMTAQSVNQGVQAMIVQAATPTMPQIVQ